MRVLTGFAFLMLSLACADPPTGLGGGLGNAWFVADPQPAYARPGLDSQRVFGAFGGEVLAVHRDNGSTAWRTRVSSSAEIAGAVLVVGEGIVLAPVTNFTVALDAETGEIRWTYLAPDDKGTGPGSVVLSTPAIAGGRAFIPAWGPSVSAVDVQSGAVAWTWVPPDSGAPRAGTTGVAVGGDTVYVTGWTWLNASGTDTRQWLVALSAAAGSQIWRVELNEPVQFVSVVAPPVVSGGVVTLTTNVVGKMLVFDRDNGAPLWSTPPPGGGASSLNFGPVAAGDTIFWPSGDGAVEARLARNGALLWRWTDVGSPARLAVTRNRVYASVGATLLVIDRASGRTMWRGSQPSASPLPEPLRFVYGVVADPVGGFIALRVAGGLRGIRAP